MNQREAEHIYIHAYVPEHLVDYVTAVSGAEPHLLRPFLCYTKNGTLIFVGYPLGEPFDQEQMEAILESSMKSLKPRVISLIAPTMSANPDKVIQRGSDSYYRLELNAITVSRGAQNMIRRAGRELSVEKGKAWNEEHASLVTEFLSTHEVSEETRHIFSRIPEYLATSKTATLLGARSTEGILVAFDVADYGSKDYAFYMFNFASRARYVPGASDLLLSELIAIARKEGKLFVNLGLAIHEGIAFFKKKWGGLSFLNHECVLYEASQTGILESLLNRL